jgi:hypothetical protein
MLFKSDTNDIYLMFKDSVLVFEGWGLLIDGLWFSSGHCPQRLPSVDRLLLIIQSTDFWFNIDVN